MFSFFTADDYLKRMASQGEGESNRTSAEEMQDNSVSRYLATLDRLDFNLCHQ